MMDIIENSNVGGAHPEYLEIILKRHESELRKIIWSHVRSLPDAEGFVEDVLQDVAVAFFRGIRGIDGDHPYPLRWLMKTSSYMAINCYRKNKRLKQHVSDAEWDFHAASNTKTDESALAGDLASAIRKCIESISETCRPVCVSRWLQGLEYEDIAEMFRINQPLVRKRVERGRAELSLCLTNKGYGDLVKQ